MTEQDRTMLTVDEAAKILGTSERHVRDLIYRRSIPYLKIGRLVRLDSQELADWIRERRVPAGGGQPANPRASIHYEALSDSPLNPLDELEEIAQSLISSIRNLREGRL